MLNKNIETFIGCDCEYEDAKIVIFGAPFDSTTSYRPGARFGPKAIRNESFGLETYSPYVDRDLADMSIFDSGDLELSFGDTGLALLDIEERTRVILNDGKLPLMIGGEHLVTLGAVKAIVHKYPKLNIIHFDAHGDLRDDYLGAKLSHACVMRRCWELVGNDRIFQFGIRSGDREEFLWGADHVKTQRFNFEGLKETINSIDKEPVYLSIDLDILDPSVFPGTGTPEAGGVSFLQLIDAIYAVCETSQIVGCDVTELSPIYDPSGISTATACKVIRELLLSL
ncbi:MAG TPA: agmatinase [Clostridia bacterium]|nr:agmatinase [Clostridia bacterium]